MSALYGKVDSESQEDLIEAPPRPRRRLASARWCPWLIHTSLFCLWLILFVSLRPSTYRQQSTPSPADEAIEYRSMLFNGSVTHPSIFEGHPSAELDAAWDRITKIRLIAVTDDDLSRSGKSAAPSMLKYKKGGGYAAELQVVHELHCLNMLRQATYPDSYDHNETTPEVWRSHLDHCVEMLRQQIMCTGDVGLLVFHWVEGHVNPWPDYNTWHQCRDYEKILAWRDEHESHLPLELSEGIVRLKETPDRKSVV